MSSKKARRRKQKEQRQDERKRRVNPATLFIVGIGLAVILTVAAAALFTDGSAPEDPPWPGATWSAAHGHWH